MAQSWSWSSAWSPRLGVYQERHLKDGAASSGAGYFRSISSDRANRPPDDFYRTPEVATRRLLAVERIRGPVWEPCCGDGAISRVLEGRGVEVFSSDLVDRGYGAAGVDFFSAELPPGAMDIVTNPPFGQIDRFVAQALDVAPRKVVVLARLLWLEGRRRNRFFACAPLARVWVSSSRLSVGRAGRDYGNGGGLGGVVAFAWYVFVRGRVGHPRLAWLPEDVA